MLSLAALACTSAARADISTSWKGNTGSWTDPTQWTGGVVPVNNASSGALYDVTMSAGTASFANGYSDTIQSLNLSNATLAGSFATLTAATGFTFGGTNSSNPTQISYMYLNNPSGAMSVLNAASNATITTNGDFTFTNLGTFSALSGSLQAQTFNNSGAILVNAGSNVIQLSAQFIGSGSLNIQSGTLALEPAFSSTWLGNLNPSVAAGATFAISNLPGQSLAQTLLAFNSSTGNFAVTGDSISISNNQSYGAAGTTITGGELDINSRNASTGLLTLNPGCTLKMLGSSGKFLVTGSFNGSGSATLGAGSIYFNGSSGVYTGTLLMQSSTGLVNNGTLTVGAGAFNSNGGSFTNNGSFCVNAGTGGMFSENAGFNDSGGTYVQSGTFVLNGAAATSPPNTGPFNISAGATLILNNPYDPLQGFTGSGTVVFNTGSPSIGSTIGPVTLIINAAYTTCNATVSTLSGLNVSGASNGPDHCALKGTGTLTVTGQTIIASEVDVNVNANGGLTLGANATFSGTITNSAGQLAGFAPGATRVDIYGSLNNQGTFNCSSQTIANETATAALVNSGVLNFNGSGSITLGIFNNSGTVNYNAPGATPSIQNGTLINTGTINVQAGSLGISPTAYGVSNTFGGSLSISTGANASIILLTNQKLTASITGSGTLSILGGGVIAPAAYNFGGTTSVSGATIGANNSFGSTGALVDTGKVTLAAANSGSLSVRYIPKLTVNASDSFIVQSSNTSASRTLLSLGSLSLPGSLDLGNNDMQLTSGALATIWTAVSSGYANGTWNGSGLTSTAAKSDTNHLLALGVIQNNQAGSALFTTSHPFDGLTPGPADILVKSTYYGDATLDGKIDGSDYSRIDSGYLSGASGWFNGDFNYDGAVNGSDYTLIDNAFNIQGAQISSQIVQSTDQVSAGEWASVPEPGVSTSIMALAILGTRRRARVWEHS